LQAEKEALKSGVKVTSELSGKIQQLESDLAEKTSLAAQLEVKVAKMLESIEAEKCGLQTKLCDATKSIDTWKAENEVLASQNEELKSKVKAAKAQSEDLQRHLEATTMERNEACSKLSEAITSIGILQQQIDDLQKRGGETKFRTILSHLLHAFVSNCVKAPDIVRCRLKWVLLN